MALMGWVRESCGFVSAGDSEEGCWVKTRKISTARPMTPQMRVMRELVFLERAVFIGLGMGFSL